MQVGEQAFGAPIQMRRPAHLAFELGVDAVHDFLPTDSVPGQNDDQLGSIEGFPPESDPRPCSVGR